MGKVGNIQKNAFSSKTKFGRTRKGAKKYVNNSSTYV